MIPQKLRKGDTIGVIAPSSKIEEKDLSAIEASKQVLEQAGYKVRFAKHALEQTDKIAISPEKRAADIQEMFEAEEVKMIFFLTGGAVSNTVFSYLDYDVIEKHPKILCGFSDATSLLNMIYQRTGLVTFHGATFKSLTSWGSDYGFSEIQRVLEQAGKEMVLSPQYTVIQEGKAEGIMIGGNISLFSRMITGVYRVDVKDKILFLEELGWETPPDMLYNYLYNMKQNGVFENIKGLWLGNYEHPSGVSLPQIIEEVLGTDISYPIIHSNHFGHVAEQSVIPIGVRVTIDTKEKIMIRREKCVE